MTHASTDIELREGQIVRVPDEWTDHNNDELFVVAREKVYGHYEWGLNVIPHYNSHGKLCRPSDASHIWSDGEWMDDDEGRADFIDKVLSKCEANPVASLGLGKQITERGSTWYQPQSYQRPPVFHANNDGLPACGAKVSRDETKEAGRFDPWNKVTCPERREQSVWLPSTHEPTCKKCAKHSK